MVDSAGPTIIVSMFSMHIGACVFTATPPGGDIGQHEIGAQTRLGDCGQERTKRAGFQYAGAKRIDEPDLPRRTASASPGVPIWLS